MANNKRQEQRKERKQAVDRHHRKPRSMGGGNKSQNISWVRKHYHRAYHLLFGTGDPVIVAQVLNEVWIDPSYMLVVKRRTDDG